MIGEQPNFWYQVLTLDLTNARINQEIEMMGGFIYCLNSSSPSMQISIKLENSANDSLPLFRQFGVIGQFKKFFLTNTAQAGVTCNLLISSDFDSLRIFEQVAASSVTLLNLAEAVTPTIYNVACASANTEYSQSLGSVRKFLIRPRTGTLKVCFTSGQSGTTFITIPAGSTYSEDLIHPTAITLYFQNDTASTVAEIVTWV
jgi:hypothetical protein